MSQARPVDQTIAGLRPADTASLIAAAADVALLLDDQGVIRDMSVASQELAELVRPDWIGRPWLDTVTIESRPKVEALLKSADTAAKPRWRHINHPGDRGDSTPVLYSIVRAGNAGQMLAIGRDLRQFTAIQQRLVSAQQAMQRDYTRLRQMEMRYRALFEVVSEPVLVVDGATLRVTEANPAAVRLFDESARRLVGRAVADCVEANGRPALLTLLETVRSGKQAEPLSLALARAEHTTVQVSATVFRPDAGVLFLVRLSLASGAVPGQASATPSPIVQAVDAVPDALVVTDPAGQILYANTSFAEMAELDSSDQAVGDPLDRWLGRSGVDLGVLMSNLRRNEAVRLFPTVIRGRFGNETSVEVSAAAASAGKLACLGFTIRDVSRRLSPEGHGNARLSQSVGQLAELVGQMSLKDIVGETTDLIEQMCIESALQLTRDNRAAAAEMLGLSRQSLYVKLRRYGLGDPQAGDGS